MTTIELSTQDAQVALRKHQRWMNDCGGTIEGYRRNYGHQRGLDAYEEDTATLRRLQRLANGGSVPASRPDYADVAEWFVCVSKDCDYIATSLAEIHRHDQSHI